jgi:hypothetical protein
MVSEINIYVAFLAAAILLAVSVRLGISLYETK